MVRVGMLGPLDASQDGLMVNRSFSNQVVIQSLSSWGRIVGLMGLVTKVLRQFLGKGSYGDNNLWYYRIPGALWGGRKGRGLIMVTAVVAVVEDVVVTAKNSLCGSGWVWSSKWQLRKLSNYKCRLVIFDMKIGRKRTMIRNNRIH